MTTNRFPADLRPAVRIAYATCWEALVESHVTQALAFVKEFAPRMSPLGALDLYFEVVSVLEPMVEPVRCRTLVGLDLESLLPHVTPPPLAGWHVVRLDLHLRRLRERVRYNERTLELARLAGATAAEELVATHVRNAVGFAGLVSQVLTFERGVEHYLREFGLALATAQTVAQRAHAEVAALQLARQYRDTEEVVIGQGALPQVS